MNENERHAEMISRQVQSAVAPLTSVIAGLQKELRDIKVELQAIREENKVFKDLITGAKFLGMTGKFILTIGAIFGMFWAMFLAVNHKT